MMKLLLMLLLPVSVFTYTVNTVNYGLVDLNRNTGKKILLVNIATRGDNVDQIAALERLHQMYQDSLLVIGFPTNSFGNEPHTASQMEMLFSDSFPVNFPVAELSDVVGSNKPAIYEWLSDSSKNGVRSIVPTKDFQKVLIGKDGRIIGLFNSMVSPLDKSIQDAVKRQY